MTHRLITSLLLLVALALVAGLKWIEPAGAQSSPLAYSRLKGKQRVLFDQWANERNKADRTTLSPTQIYEQLTVSQRTTYEAATHALMRSKLTDRAGKPMGAAIDLIQALESIAGKEQGKRGDHQFRLYALMAPDTEQRLLASREFKRGKDNTVFHKGYPLNFRQSGRYPSIQISMTRGGDRADIDVDYRSSKPPGALFNGHLTAGNSDVRAGGNYVRHVFRWSGLLNWWRALFEQEEQEATAGAPATDATDVVEPDLPDGAAIERITDATQEFFNDWLVRRKQRLALHFYEPGAAACVNADEDAEDERLSARDARKLFVEILEATTRALGKHRSLATAIEAMEPWDQELTVVEHANKPFFTLAGISDAEAEEYTCKREPPVEPPVGTQAAGAPPQYGNYYQTIFRFKLKRDQGGGMSLLWKKEDGKWRIVSFDELDH
ncbi:MAG: hypothetical protein ACREEM_09600 [Blastocatellia bacterium]